MTDEVCVFLFCDALGWELVNRYHFMEKEFPFRYPVRTQFGYSSAAVPTILSGEPPEKHGHFSFFLRAGAGKSPFGIFRRIHFLLHPSAVFDNHRIRSRVSRLFKKISGYTGYFNLYRVPYSRLPYLDYCEKKDIFAKNGLAPVPNLRDMLEETGIPFHISDWRKSDGENLDIAEKLLREGKTKFFFIYTAGLDGFLHFHVGEPEAVEKRFAEFSERVRTLLTAAGESAKTVRFHLFSDHGMTPLTGSVDLRRRVEALDLEFGVDYIACYDSTMLRISILNPAYREKLLGVSAGIAGHWLSEGEKKALGIAFPDGRYGDEIFLLDPGIQLVPGDMGGKPIPGMHGYSPDDRHSEAALLCNAEPELKPFSIADFFRLMKHAAFRMAGRPC